MIRLLRNLLRCLLRCLLRTCPRCLPCLLSLSLLYAGAHAAPVMTFNANSTASGIPDAIASQWTDSKFIEQGERSNFSYVLRDYVRVEDGMRYIYHLRDVSYDVAGYLRDGVLISVDGLASGAHSVQFNVSAMLDATQAGRLVDGGDLSFQVSMLLNGKYVESPAGPPAPPTFIDLSSGMPVELAAEMTTEIELRYFDATALDDFTAPRDLFNHEFSYLIEAGEHLLSERAAFTLHGPGYDASTRRLTYTELLGMDVVPVPEPEVWMMLLAGACVLALSRHSRSLVFRN